VRAVAAGEFAGIFRLGSRLPRVFVSALASPVRRGVVRRGRERVAAVRCGVGGMGTLMFPTRVAFGNDAKRVSHAAKRVWQKTQATPHSNAKKRDRKSKFRSHRGTCYHVRATDVPPDGSMIRPKGAMH